MARDYAARVVGGSVVDDDDLVAGPERLRTEMSQALVEERRPVVGRDDDRDAR